MELESFYTVYVCGPNEDLIVNDTLTISSPEFLSVLRQANLTFGEVRTKSFMLLFSARCTHMWLLCCKVLQAVIHWMCVDCRVVIKQIKAVMAVEAESLKARLVNLKRSKALDRQ